MDGNDTGLHAATRGRRDHLRKPIARALLVLCASVVSASAFAQAAPPSVDIRELQAQIDLLKREQAERDARIGTLEQSLRQLQATATSAEAATLSTTSKAPATAPNAAASRLAVSGDLRVRLQGDYSDPRAPDRLSSQVRARIGATWDATDRVRIGARLVTGDPGDPNSTDVQLSNFNDDLQVSLDQAYVQFDLGKLKLFGGKFPQPFSRTDLVWDSDVMPQGAAAVFRQPLGNGGALRANGMLFVVDERAAGADSTMLGMQAGYDSPAFGDWKLDATVGYYDYELRSVASADAGDFRSNLRNADGSYRSDFNLVNLLAGVSYAGFSPDWPLRLTLDYVVNRGAATDADTGYGLDLAFGKASTRGDWRLTYGYSTAETDAVFAAFSHDNIGIATNYKLHALTVDYVPSPKTLLTGIWYHYRPLHATDASARGDVQWLDRFRLAFLVNF